MQNSILKIEGITILSRKSQQFIKGADSVDMSLCVCSCSGAIIGPAYCDRTQHCPQIYTCGPATF